MRSSLKAVLTLFVCASAAGPAEAAFEEERRAMLVDQLERRGIRDGRVLEAMEKVERHLFVPYDVRSAAYADHPLPIGFGQTISQPYIVAFMTEAAAIRPTDRVLEIGTGSGYQAAVLGELAAEVYSIELLKPLADTAARRLASLGYANVRVRQGDGYAGWPEAGPFDAIVVTAAPEEVPEALVEQLAEGGRLVIPAGPSGSQELFLYVKAEGGRVERKRLIGVSFVPMVPGAAAEL
jgi:protein-L-isoaspartate(D-aspartate) O-methyltransferase